MTKHQRGHRPMPAPDAKPATAVAGAVADHMDVHVDGFEGRRGACLGVSHKRVVIWLRKEIEEVLFWRVCY